MKLRRYIAWKTGCTVHGFDIQGELIAAATRVAKEVGIAHLTRFEHADCTSPRCTFPDTAYDGFYCILVMLPILLAFNDHNLLVYRIRGRRLLSQDQEQRALRSYNEF